MRRLRSGSALTFGFSLLSAWFLWESFALSRVASTVPRLVLVLTLVLLAADGLRSWFHARERGGEAVPDGDEAAGPVPPKVDAGAGARCLAWIALLPAALWLFGLLAGSAVYCLLFLRWRSRESWVFSLAVALGLGGVLTLLYSVVFPAAPYAGLWAL